MATSSEFLKPAKRDPQVGSDCAGSPVALVKSIGQPAFHHGILKSSAVMAVSSVANLAFGVVRTKAFALALGPAGVGTMGVYLSVTSLFSTLAGFGISNSGVREIAAAQSSGDEVAVGRATKVLRRVTLFLGLAGLLLMAGLHTPISVIGFGGEQARVAEVGRHFFSQPSGALLLLSLSVLFTVVSGGQSALVQGYRKIMELARIRMVGALLGTLVSVPIIWWLRNDGIVPAILSISGLGLLSSWWYARKIRVVSPVLSWAETWRGAQALLRLGGAFMTSVLIVAGIACLARVLIARQLGLSSAGHYVAAVTLSGLYVGFLTQAMSADFFPRLSEQSKDDAASNNLVNEQTEVGLLVAAPGLMATLAFGPLAIRSFYTVEFLAAVPLLYVLLLGVLVQMISWPLGYLLLAKGSSLFYCRSVIVANLVHVGLLVLAVRLYGLVGAGLASLAFDTVQLALLFTSARCATRFSWWKSNVRLALTLFPALAATAILCRLLPGIWPAVVGAAATATTGYCVFRRLAPHLRHLWQSVFSIEVKETTCS